MQISVEDHGLFDPQEKASLIDFVKRVQRHYASEGFDFQFKEISLEVWRSSSFIFHNFTYAEDGKLKVVMDKSEIEGPSAKQSSPMRYFMDSREAISIFPTERNTPGLQREQLSLWLLSLQERIKFWRNFLGIKKNLSWKTLMPVAGSGIIV